MIVDAVVCARDEADTVVGVVEALLGSGTVARVIVVDDGSTDGTGAAARRAGAVVVAGPAKGKGEAMAVGACLVNTGRMLFCDADLAGLRAGIVADLCSVDVAGQVVGIRKLGRTWRLPPVSGERVVPTGLVRALRLTGWKAELQIDAAICNAGLRSVHVPCPYDHERGRLTPGEVGQIVLAAAENLPGVLRYPATVAG